MEDNLFEFVNKMEVLLDLNNEIIESIENGYNVSNNIERDLFTIRDILETYIYKMNNTLS